MEWFFFTVCQWLSWRSVISRSLDKFFSFFSHFAQTIYTQAVHAYIWMQFQFVRSIEIGVWKGQKAGKKKHVKLKCKFWQRQNHFCAFATCTSKFPHYIFHISSSTFATVASKRVQYNFATPLLFAEKLLIFLVSFIMLAFPRKWKMRAPSAKWTKKAKGKCEQSWVCVCSLVTFFFCQSSQMTHKGNRLIGAWKEPMCHTRHSHIFTGN